MGGHDLITRLIAFALLLTTIIAGPALAQAPAQVKAAAAARVMVSAAPHPTFDEGTVQRIAAAMLSYTVLEVQGGWPTLPANARLVPGARGRTFWRCAGASP